MGELILRRALARRTRELVNWKVAAIGLLVFASLVNGLYAAAVMNYRRQLASQAEQLRQAEHTRDLAVQELGALTLRAEADAEARAAQARAYEAAGIYTYVGNCTVTAYCCEPYEHICGTGDGLTASGIPVSPGIVAVDPEVIPLGSTVVIDGKQYLAADTGGAVKGLHVDVCVSTHREAEAFGVQSAEVWRACTPARLEEPRKEVWIYGE